MSLRDSAGRAVVAYHATTGFEIRAATFIAGTGPLSPPIDDVDIRIPTKATLRRVTILTSGVAGAATNGSCAVDIWKDSYANWPPTNADDITGGVSPAISNGTKYDNSALAGWSTALAAGDVLRVHLASSSVFRRITVQLELEVEAT